MDSNAIRHVSVWLDQNTSSSEIISRGVYWAYRLHIPLRAIMNRAVRTANSNEPSLALMRACQDLDVECDHAYWSGIDDWGYRQMMSPGSLCLVEHGLPPQFRDEMFQGFCRCTEAAMVVSPRKSRAIEQALILCPSESLNARYCNAAAKLCQELGVPTRFVVLATTACEGQKHLSFVTGFFAARGSVFDFDVRVVSDVTALVEQIARRDNCSHLFLPRSLDPAWWRWLRRQFQCRPDSDKVTYVILPNNGIGLSTSSTSKA